MRLSPLRSISSFLFVAALALSCYDGLSGLGGFDCSNDNTCPAGYVCQGASGIPLVAFDASADAGE
ncbi:MAG: hypothetical protein ABSE49_12390, partial [Polyangiaceae bacterium]